MPMSFPMANEHFAPNGFKLPIARYPIHKWKKEGKPFLSVAGWAKLCVVIARGDEPNLGGIFETSLNLLKRMGGETSPSIKKLLDRKDDDDDD